MTGKYGNGHGKENDYEYRFSYKQTEEANKYYIRLACKNGHMERDKPLRRGRCKKFSTDYEKIQFATSRFPRNKT